MKIELEAEQLFMCSSSGSLSCTRSRGTHLQCLVSLLSQGLKLLLVPLQQEGEERGNEQSIPS